MPGLPATPRVRRTSRTWTEACYFLPRPTNTVQHETFYLSRTRYYEQKNNKTIVNLYTDRAIYRPGQTVHAAAILAINERGTDAKAFEKGKEVKMELYDANWKVVAGRRLSRRTITEWLPPTSCCHKAD